MGEWTGTVIVRNRILSILTINNAWLRKQRVKTSCFFIHDNGKFAKRAFHCLETDEYDERMGMPATANPFEWRQTLILFRYTDIMRVGDDNGNQ